MVFVKQFLVTISQRILINSQLGMSGVPMKLVKMGYVYMENVIKKATKKFK
jgi:hypothetical protein